MVTIPWSDLVWVWAVFAGNILSPGPNVFNTIGIALGSGRAVALWVVPAIALGVACWASAAFLGAAALFAAWPAAETILRLLGAALLIWLAARYWRRALSQRRGGVAEQVGITPRVAFLTTLGVIATNPKALTTWLTLISLFPPQGADSVTVAVLVAGSVTVAAAGHAAYALVFSTRTAARAYARAAHVIDAIVGTFFALLALRLTAVALGA